MILCRKLRGGVNTPIVLDRCPEVPELVLAGSASEQVESHVHTFGLFGDDGVVDDTSGSGVVNLDGWFILWSPNFVECFVKL